MSSFTQITHVIIHRIKAFFAQKQKAGGFQGPQRKNGAILRGMNDAQRFVAAVETNIVFTCHGAAAHGMKADLLRPALSVFLAAPIGGNGAGPGHGVKQSQCSTAGGVRLLVVMLFHDLDVKAGQHFCSQPRQCF